GYATSEDGINWQRYADNPIFDEYWTEDVHVVKHGGNYFMVAEGINDIAHLLSSSDGIHWQRLGDLDIRKVNGEPIGPGAYGTPTLWIDGDSWYLFYERGDLGIWLAVSTDQKVWTNIQDDPVIEMGPDKYDAKGVAVNQIVKYKGRYYAYYHGTPDEDWATWNSNVAVSDDLIHWTKYENNPIVDTDSISGNYSSPILVYDGDKYRLYTMHESVKVYYPIEVN
ncbi:MAG: glycosylase, partial [Cyclobacteriaceae bacterium]|nr:glycosylase [Cyclobacteriaceae bacterium]